VSRLVVMGSGETAPTMVRIHRELMAATPPGAAVMIDTPFAFQMNRDELVARTRLYFAQSVGREIEVVHWPPQEGDPAAEERSLALLDSATWVFAGPGSPTYALRCWRDTPVPAALTAVVRRGGTLVMGSAAAVTLGSHAVPVYEIYKVGADPVWEQGLDLLGGLAGLAAAVLPHYDNREGGTHDTRFCYLGELRLASLERQLPHEVGVLGVDEHTAAVIDVAAVSLRVLGNGRLSVRRRGVTTTCAPGADVPLLRLDRLLRGVEGATVPATAPVRGGDGSDVTDAASSSVREDADRARSAFDAALARGDMPGCVAAVLALESAIADWRADTWQSGELEDARRVLRALVVQLGDVAQTGARDPGEVVGPYLDLLIDLRRSARENRDFVTSDLVRERLVGLGVEVRDTSEGSSWRLPGV